MSGLIIRRAVRGDIDAISAIEVSSFPSDRLSRRQISYLLGRDTALILVATLEAVVIGCCVGLLPKAPRPGRIYSLAVLPAYRGRAIARQLMTGMAAEMRQRGYGRCRLEVRSSALQPQALYRQLGFRELRVLPGYYEDGEDALKMELALHTDGDSL